MPPLDRQVKVCILYEYKLGNAADLAFLNVNRAFGDGTVTNATVHRWFSQFQDGEESLDREPTAELEYGEDGIEEDPVIVEALLARQFGLEPGTLHMHLDVLGRGEKLKEARDAQQRVSSLRIGISFLFFFVAYSYAFPNFLALYNAQLVREPVLLW